MERTSLSKLLHETAVEVEALGMKCTAACRQGKNDELEGKTCLINVFGGLGKRVRGEKSILKSKMLQELEETSCENFPFSTRRKVES